MNTAVLLQGLQTSWMWHCFVSISEIHYSCVNAINCTGKNMSENLLYALSLADANEYLCSEDLRPCENRFYFFLFVTRVLSSVMQLSAAITLECNFSTSICVKFTLNEYLLLWLSLVKHSQNVDRCAVVSEDPEWGCVSEHGWDTMMTCYNESVPANKTGVSSMDSCRQVMRFCCIKNAHFLYAFYGGKQWFLRILSGDRL